MLWAFPRFDARTVEVTLGVVAVPGSPAFIRFVVSRMPKSKDGGDA